MPARRSQFGLDGLNFFAANVQTGFGAFIAVYLTSHAWPEFEIGLALGIGTLAAMLSQVPAGILVDALTNKRLAAAAALVAIALSGLLFAAWPATLPVMVAEVLHGFASCVLVPAIAALSLALVGEAGLGERVGRNARFAALGSAIAAGAMGWVGTYVSGAAVFWLTAAVALPALGALYAMRGRDLAPRRYPEHHTGTAARGLRRLMRDRRVLIFAACCGLFTLANAAMLPLAASAVTRRASDEANLVVAAAIILPQAVVALISPWFGRLAERIGRRPVLIAGFAALPVRGLLLAVIHDPIALALVQALDGISGAALGVLLPLLAADLTRGTERFNTCLGLFGLAVGIGGTVSTVVAGAVAGWLGFGVAFALLAATGLGALILLVLTLPETRPREDPLAALA